ncbi:uncharacterized protein F4807DRAFT_455644 [Annulohypoxylon truncatum]|uniref:uncharacterized protein n=1 Tax=Annulohypoxylon truncatum TaxID=327061 RepID=UPI002008EA57|nr:uncharacterized protein F4807DRAFT_455644 [Annulohypoxylon truncatum]KAI1215194.1 hypothetical protein F4807DRAFT_455644 [Annulohypoxylon truncatum]
MSKTPSRTLSRRTRFRSDKPKEGIIWTKGMRLGPGAPHDPVFMRRILDSDRKEGAGTIEDPKVIWLVPVSHTKNVRMLQEVEAVIRNQTKEFGLSYAWIASTVHDTSTIRWTGDKRVVGPDDSHVTLRIGSSANTCNLHGHIYLISRDNGLEIGMMPEGERGVEGGKNPQLWIWGPYPRGWPRAKIQYPEWPWVIKPGSILYLREAAKPNKDERKVFEESQAHASI